MNKVFLAGNLANDPEVKSYSNNSFTVFTVAVSDGYGDKKKTFFFDCVASGKTGENIAKFFEKGKAGIFEGKLYTRKNDEGHVENKISIYGFDFVSGTNSKKTGSKKENNKQEAPPVDDIPF